MPSCSCSHHRLSSRLVPSLPPPPTSWPTSPGLVCTPHGAGVRGGWCEHAGEGGLGGSHPLPTPPPLPFPPPDGTKSQPPSSSYSVFRCLQAGIDDTDQPVLPPAAFMYLCDCCLNLFSSGDRRKCRSARGVCRVNHCSARNERSHRGRQRRQRRPCDGCGHGGRRQARVQSRPGRADRGLKLTYGSTRHYTGQSVPSFFSFLPV